jgi:imidazolonepropionase-like amidohydrolase
MKKTIIKIVALLLLCTQTNAQDNMLPAGKQQGTMAITNATIHVGNGTVIENGAIVFTDGKISYVGSVAAMPKGSASSMDAQGKHVYPGLILANSNLGLVEINSTKSTIDESELGDLNTNIRSIVAYNTDSKVINTLRSNGILLANVVPNGELVTGSSSVVQLDAWNFEDAVYKADNAMHFNMPSLIIRPDPFADFRPTPLPPASERLKKAVEQIEMVKNFFREAGAYLAQTTHTATNLKFEAVRKVFSKQEKLFVHCDAVKEMLVAVDFVKEFGFNVVIVGGSESFLIADLLKQHNLPVILSQMHNLPTMQDDDVDQPYKTPAALQAAGVLFAINDDDGQTRGRNLSFNAGTAVAYGLTKEQALTSITLNAAKILGVDAMTGSLEVGKDANIVVSSGDILDMKSSNITNAFIQGRTINLDDKHKQLNEKYKTKYGIK